MWAENFASIGAHCAGPAVPMNQCGVKLLDAFLGFNAKRIVSLPLRFVIIHWWVYLTLNQPAKLIKHFFFKCSNVLLLQKTDKTSPGRLKNLLQDVDMNCLSAAACRRRAKRVSSAYFASNSSNVDNRVAAPGTASQHLHRKITSPAAHCHPVSCRLWLIKVLNVIARVKKYYYNQIYMCKLFVCLGKLVNANKESVQQLGNIHRCAFKCQW